MSKPWCLDQQVEIVEKVLEGAIELSSRNPVATLNLLLFASSRIPKLALVSLGSLRCNDLPKERGNLEEYVVKMIRKALRMVVKEVCSIDAARISEKLRLSSDAKSSVERSLNNASSRARSALQKKLAPLYEELEGRFGELKSVIDAMDKRELLSGGLERVLMYAEEIMRNGFLKEEELSRITSVALAVLSTEIEKSFKRIAPRLGVAVRELRSMVLEWGFVRERIEAMLRRASNLLKCFVASILVRYALTKIESMVLNPVQQSEAVRPSELSLESSGRAARLLLDCLSLIR